GKVDAILDGVDPAKVRGTLSNIEQASRDARTAAADVANVTEKFNRRSDDIEQMISDASELTGRLNAASVRIDGVLAKVDSLLGSGEAQGVMADASATLKSFRQVADTLNARLATITDGLARFSGQGLREVESLVRDGRRSINRIEQAITDLERNPQRIITGGEGTVRQYDGRARR
ncbi:MAG: MCE family protein, partial [Pseudaminobacter sp.]